MIWLLLEAFYLVMHQVVCDVQFVPFIQGPRNCLGQNFAVLEARVVLALIVKVCREDVTDVHAH